MVLLCMVMEIGVSHMIDRDIDKNRGARARRRGLKRDHVQESTYRVIRKLARVGGILDRAMGSAEARERVAQPLFRVATALSAMSMACAKVVSLKDQPALKARIWLMLFGETCTGKSSSLETLHDLDLGTRRAWQDRVTFQLHSNLWVIKRSIDRDDGILVVDCDSLMAMAFAKYAADPKGGSGPGASMCGVHMLARPYTLREADPLPSEMIVFTATDKLFPGESSMKATPEIDQALLDLVIRWRTLQNQIVLEPTEAAMEMMEDEPEEKAANLARVAMLFAADSIISPASLPEGATSPITTDHLDAAKLVLSTATPVSEVQRPHPKRRGR
jgi:hypothetical protein